MPMHAGRTYLALDDILPPLAEDALDDIVEESDNVCEKSCPTTRCYRTRKTGFQKFEPKLHNGIIRKWRYLEVIEYHALGLSAGYEQSLVANEDMA
jgi:hypothetical protein